MEPGRLARSYLYVPGDRGDVLHKAPGRRADALVLDLEDAVTLSHKEQARQVVAEFVTDAPATSRLWVRINSDQVDADLAVLAPAVDGIWVPKAEPELLRAVDVALSGVERRLGLADRTFQVVALIETARGCSTRRGSRAHRGCCASASARRTWPESSGCSRGRIGPN
jgi:citrate lyase subunit beta/citryl-CoA lyase